jgi:hypothetical protein
MEEFECEHKLMTSIVPIVECPMCRGTGKDYSIIHHQQTSCDLCKGIGWVPRENCKGCGRPAIKSWPPAQAPIVRYCGLEVCLDELVAIHKPGSNINHGSYQPMGRYLPGMEDDEFDPALNMM